MHTNYILLVFVFALSNLNAQEPWVDKSRILPESLRKIPVEIFITHDPNPNYPEINDTGQNMHHNYVWKHSTTVISPNLELEIIQVGSFIWYDQHGWKENVIFNKRDFKKKFNCPGGILKAGQRYTWEKNYRYGSILFGGDALWYVLARDAEGKIYKGIGLIETESELQN